MAKGKRQSRVTQPQPLQGYAERPFFSGFGSPKRGDRAEEMKRCLLDEAQYLTGVGDPRGQELQDLVSRLPYASLERIAG